MWKEVLFLVFSQQLSVYSLATASELPAPTNVTVVCHSFTNVMYWNYTALDVQPEFIVLIRSYQSKQKEVNTTDTFLDISEYTKNVEFTYMLSVEAYLRGNRSIRSGPSTPIPFSYSSDFYSSENKCVMDFPAINVSVIKNIVHISFYHPHEVYDVQGLNEDFLYTCNELESTCYEEETRCTKEMPYVETLNDRCITVHFKGSVSGIPTETTKEICGPVDRPEVDWVALTTGIVCAVVFIMMVGSLFIVLFCKKIKESASSQASLINKLVQVVVKSDQMIVLPDDPGLSEITNVGHTPLLDEDEDVSLPCRHSTLEDTHLPTGFNHDTDSTESQEQGEDGEEDGYERRNGDSGYNCPKFLVEISPGDMVKSYGPQ